MKPTATLLMFVSLALPAFGAESIEFALDVAGLKEAAHPAQYKNPGIISLAAGP